MSDDAFMQWTASLNYVIKDQESIMFALDAYRAGREQGRRDVLARIPSEPEAHQMTEDMCKDDDVSKKFPMIMWVRLRERLESK